MNIEQFIINHDLKNISFPLNEHISENTRTEFTENRESIIESYFSDIIDKIDKRRFDELYEKSLSITNSDKRVVLYKQMDSIIMKDLPVVPLFYDEVVRFKHQNIKGLTTNATNLLELKKVYKTIN